MPKIKTKHECVQKHMSPSANTRTAPSLALAVLLLIALLKGLLGGGGLMARRGKARGALHGLFMTFSASTVTPGKSHRFVL